MKCTFLICTTLIASMALITALSFALAIAIGFGAIGFSQYRKAIVIEYAEVLRGLGRDEKAAQIETANLSAERQPSQ